VIDMSKPISISKMKNMILAMDSVKKQETIARQLRVLPRFIQEEKERIFPNNPKVLIDLEKRLKMIQDLWVKEIVSRHGVS
jgi:hypothetical protein